MYVDVFSIHYIIKISMNVNYDNFMIYVFAYFLLALQLH
jgi:hypothetical protein